jgi:hypothetical protein
MSKAIHRRCVIYFAGFDPSSPAHYHRKYMLHGAQQSTLTGYQLEVGDRYKKGPHMPAWNVKFTAPEQETHQDSTHTDYIFAQWDDIVRCHWTRLETTRNKLHWLKKFVATQWFYLKDGALLRMLRLSWPPVVALIAPMFLLLFTAIFWFITPFMGWHFLKASHIFSVPEWMYALLPAALMWFAVSCLLFKLVHHLEAKFHMLWLMHSYIFTCDLSQGKIPHLEQRLQEFGATIKNAVHNELYDEVLIVGHSSGAIMATSALAYAIESAPSLAMDASKTHVSLVTLGQCIPIYSSISAAVKYREQLASIAKTPGLTWVDFCAPSDGCSFAFVDVTASTNSSESIYCSKPKLLSPKIHTQFDAQDYKQLRRDRFELHFQYLHAGKIVGEYDYFSMTAGSQSLHARYGSMQSVSGYTKFQIFK